MKTKKTAFTLIEALICITVISLSVIAATKIISLYQKTVYERDINMQTLAENISVLEDIKANVKELSDIFPYTQNNVIRIFAVGIGEIEVSEDGSFTVVNPEEDTFSESIKPKKTNLLRLEIGNTQKILAVIRL